MLTPVPNIEPPEFVGLIPAIELPAWEVEKLLENVLPPVPIIIGECVEEGVEGLVEKVNPPVPIITGE